MLVRMRGTISGTRNGQPWPDRGEEIDLPDAEAAELCANRMAEPAELADAVEQEPGESSEPDGSIVGDPETATAPEPETPEKPRGRAAKAK